ncbi:TetR family transcriptional regulator [Mitsuaria sp. 7]|uniref:TetR family transcriptional regulator n=1 Tax=Mitsuaria sp. 7 TaxID=1658665 RepID=UPI0009ED9C0A|nr:TetR family transcriptional regulator [Mitsuaria sp. 7]
MSTRKPPQISSRKLPQQARSTDLVAAILQAAIQVLEKEGAARFTTARVAERAGVSVGSVYQYFPNKAAILFRLQSDEWQETTETLRRILEDRKRPPLERLRVLVLTFIKSECEEADMRVALNDAAPLYRDAPESQAAKSEVNETMARFMEEAAPEAGVAARALAADLVLTTLSVVGHDFSASPRTGPEIKAYANALADMFCAYIGNLTDAGTPAASQTSDAPEAGGTTVKARLRAKPAPAPMPLTPLKAKAKPKAKAPAKSTSSRRRAP